MVGQKEIFISPVEVLCGAVYAWVLVSKGLTGMFFYIYAMASSFFYVYVMATSFPKIGHFQAGSPRVANGRQGFPRSKGDPRDG